MSSATRPRYPQHWPQIALDIKCAANWTCQHCDQPHDPNPKTGCTLTVHHIDGNPHNNDPSNTRALCQRCHLRAARGQRKYGRDHQQQPKLFTEKGDTP